MAHARFQALTGLGIALTMACACAPGAAAQERPLLQAQPVQQLQPVQQGQYTIQDFGAMRPVVSDAPPPRRGRLARIDWTQAFADRQRDLVRIREALAGQTNATNAVRVPQRAQIADRAQAQIEPVHMPVLLPLWGANLSIRPGGEPGVMLITRAHFYDASYHDAGMTVHISGTRIINHGEESARAVRFDRGRGPDGLRVTRDEAGLTADFSRYGAAYTVSIECGSATDPRCATETALRQLVAELYVAGGNPEAGG
ncbi:MAG: hypothetical protein ABL308_01595 [Oceanicaulis sp.]